MILVKLRRMPHGEGIDRPAYRTPGAVGMDLCACVDEDLVLPAGDSTLISTGFAIEIPQGHEGQVRPRSGLALKHGLMVINSPGTIDPDYRGELKVILGNFGKEPYTIKRGDRIAQLVICPAVRAVVREVETLTNTNRGDGGFGSTGTE